VVGIDSYSFYDSDSAILDFVAFSPFERRYKTKYGKFTGEYEHSLWMHLTIFRFNIVVEVVFKAGNIPPEDAKKAWHEQRRRNRVKR